MPKHFHKPSSWHSVKSVTLCRLEQILDLSETWKLVSQFSPPDHRLILGWSGRPHCGAAPNGQGEITQQKIWDTTSNMWSSTPDDVSMEEIFQTFSSSVVFEDEIYSFFSCSTYGLPFYFVQLQQLVTDANKVCSKQSWRRYKSVWGYCYTAKLASFSQLLNHFSQEGNDQRWSPGLRVRFIEK